MVSLAQRGSCEGPTRALDRFGSSRRTSADALNWHPSAPLPSCSRGLVNANLRDAFLLQVTHNGLDVMVRRMISEMRLLTEDADEDVAYNGTR